ncbi:MAG: hypothetical protein EOP82_21705, partial [Variovorax sp.]
MKRREQAAGLKDGGPVRGPGTGTSDSIHKKVPEGSYIMPADSTAAIGDEALQSMGKDVPVNISNGEHELPPEQVHAIGVQALDKMKAATHTPAAEQGAQGAQGFKPEMYFANGGLVEEDPLKRRPGANPQAPANAAPLPMLTASLPARTSLGPNASSMGPPKMGMLGGGAPDVPAPHAATTPPGSPVMPAPVRPVPPMAGRGTVNPAAAVPAPTGFTPNTAAAPAAPLPQGATSPSMPASGTPLPMLSASLPKQPTPEQAAPAYTPIKAPDMPAMGPSMLPSPPQANGTQRNAYPQPQYQQAGVPTSWKPPATAPTGFKPSSSGDAAAASVDPSTQQLAPAAPAVPNDPTMMKAVTAPFRAIGNAVASAASIYDTDEFGRPRNTSPAPVAQPAAQAQVRAVDNAPANVAAIGAAPTVAQMGSRAAMGAAVPEATAAAATGRG